MSLSINVDAAHTNTSNILQSNLAGYKYTDFVAKNLSRAVVTLRTGSVLHVAATVCENRSEVRTKGLPIGIAILHRAATILC